MASPFDNAWTLMKGIMINGQEVQPDEYGNYSAPAFDRSISMSGVNTGGGGSADAMAMFEQVQAAKRARQQQMIDAGLNPMTGAPNAPPPMMNLPYSPPPPPQSIRNRPPPTHMRRGFGTAPAPVQPVQKMDVAWHILKYDPDREAVAARNQARQMAQTPYTVRDEPITPAGKEMRERGIVDCEMCRTGTPQYNSFGQNLCNACFDDAFSQRQLPGQQAIDRANRMREEQE